MTGGNQLSESLVRLSPVLRPLTQQVLSSVFRPSPTKGEPPVPYFHLVATVRDKMNALQQEMSVAEARRRKMETDEVGCPHTYTTRTRALMLIVVSSHVRPGCRSATLENQSDGQRVQHLEE